MTTTPILDFNLPTVGANRDTWGALVNDNFSALDSFVSMAMPIGMICDFGGPVAPDGWLVCDGRNVSRTTYSALFAAIGTYWGPGDGSTTFALPNPNGRAAVGPGAVIDQNGNTLSLSFTQKLGNLSNHILQTHLPNYAMTSNTAGLHSHLNPSGSNITTPAGAHSHTTDSQGYHGHTGATSANDLTALIHDPGHGHQYSDSLVGGSGAIAGGSGYGNVDSSRNTQIATTGITIDPHVHGIFGDGAHTHTTTSVGDHYHSIYPDGSHSHTVSLGGGGAWFDIFNPVIVVTKIIFAGQQATTRVISAMTPSPAVRRLSAPLRGSH